MKALFFETSRFTATISQYLTDTAYSELQQALLANPEMGAVMPRTGGFRKARWVEPSRHKGKRGGTRVIYYWLLGPRKFWMFAVYDKDEMEALSCAEERALKRAITAELARGVV